MGNKHEFKPTKESLIGTWTGFVVVSILFLVIFRFAFGWTLQAQWWIWFIVGGTLIGAITTTIQYYTMDPVRCNNCGQVVDSKKTFCPHCSQKLLWRCPNCNAKVRPDEMFCDKCGYALQEKVKPGEPETAPKPKPNPEYQNPSFEYCKLCGMHIDKSKQKYCPGCGAEL
jgi:predicted RNA-binding Zn-ribbon protein involved in translation (DUF1610 family)